MNSFSKVHQTRLPYKISGGVFVFEEIIIFRKFLMSFTQYILLYLPVSCGVCNTCSYLYFCAD